MLDKRWSCKFLDLNPYRKTKLPSEVAEVKSFCPEEINRIKDLNIALYQKNQRLIQENADLMQLLEKETAPDA